MTMRDQAAAILAAMGRARAMFMRRDATRSGVPAHRNSDNTIGQLISVLDDRHIMAAIRLLEPKVDGSVHSRSSGDDGAPRVRCVGCGE
jgi:hypothetical protein